MKAESSTSQASCLQFIAAFTALLGASSMGAVLSYTSPAILSMQQNISSNNSSGIKFLDERETDLISWIISIVSIGALIGSLIAGPICESIGHRLCICISSLLCSFGWLIISFAANPPFVIVGRLVTGFAIGLLSSSVPVYIVEISTISIRGFLGCSFQGFITLGTLFISACGMFVDWRMLAEFCVILAIVPAIFILFFPDSPCWLARKGRQTDALKSLKRLRTSSSDCQAELDQLIEQLKNAYKSDESSIGEVRRSDIGLRIEDGSKIMNESFVNMNKLIDNFSVNSNDSEHDVKSSVKSIEQSTKSTFLNDLKLPHIYKPFLIGLMLMFFQQMSGANSLFASLEMILNSAQMNQLNEQQAALLVTLCFTAFAWLSTYVVNLFGRKTLLMFSSIGYIFSYLILGSYYWAKEANCDEFASNYSILPLIGLILFFFVHAVGFGSVCWFVIPEMTITYRNQISGICVCLNWIMSFVVTKNFTKLVEWIDYSGTFLFLAFVGLLSAIGVLFVPETKDRTAKQIKAQYYSK